MIRLILEAILVSTNAYTVYDELESLRKLKTDYFTGPGARENYFQWCNLVFVGAAIAARLAGSSDVENIFLGLHAVVGWISLMNYAVGFRQMGTLWLIFIKIVTGDLVRFSILMSVFIIGFGEALWLQMSPYASYYDHLNTNKATLSTSVNPFSSNTNNITTTTPVSTSVMSDLIATATTALMPEATEAVLNATATLIAANLTETVEAVGEGGEENPGVDDWRFLPLAFVWSFRILMQQGEY
ncbi:hypothetical protein HDU67_005621, partial [Dinochytrium kinnereticum]